MRNYDYDLDSGDKLLAFIRFAFRNHAEFRHSCLGLFALFSPLWGGRSCDCSELSRTVGFADGSLPIKLCSPIVLAAGANKNGRLISHYANMGFGGITIGSATRSFRKGNPHRPRVALDEANRIICNAMGLNNIGVEKIAANVQRQIVRAHAKGMAVGISIAESPGLAEENRLKDLSETFSIAYGTADYLEVNVSCPNTGESRLDLDTTFMQSAFGEIDRLRQRESVRKAVYAKLSPDLTERQLFTILDYLVPLNINGVIFGNTYPSEKLFYSLPALNERGTSGGVSGRVVYGNVFEKVRLIKKYAPALSVVACGGIDCGAKVSDLLAEGADFVQVYSVVAFRFMAAAKMNRELLAK